MENELLFMIMRPARKKILFRFDLRKLQKKFF